VSRPRLEQEDSASVIWSGIQVALKDVARSITGTRRRDHVTIEDLLDLAGLEIANRMVVKAIAAETLSCFNSEDGKDGARNHVGRILFSDKRTATAKTARSAKTGQIEVPLRGATPLSHTRPTCGTGRPSSAKHPQRRQKKGGIRLGKSLSTLVLRDMTPRLRLVGCSLRVVGRLLQDMGRFPGDAVRVHQEVGLFVFVTVSHSLLFPK
jgi:hypothetical protein